MEPSSVEDEDIQVEGETGESSAQGARTERLVIASEEAGERMDRLLAARIADLSRSRLKALVLAGQVTIGGRTILDPGHKVNAGDDIAVEVPAAEPAVPQGENIPLNIAYEDDDLIIIDKPAGLVVHPGAGNWTGTLVNALIAHCGTSLSGIGGVKRPGVVHRLDKDTTGLLVVAKNDKTHQGLTAQFADHGRTGPLQRRYIAFVWGAPRDPKGTVNKPIDRHPHARDKMSIRAGGREAITHWQVLERYNDVEGKAVAAMIECSLETGRTHQIRVHMASVGHPVIGDEVYGPGYRTKAGRLPKSAQEALSDLGRQALHAHILGVEHPSTHEFIEFRSTLPDDLGRLRHALGPGQTGAGG